MEKENWLSVNCDFNKRSKLKEYPFSISLNTKQTKEFDYKTINSIIKKEDIENFINKYKGKIVKTQTVNGEIRFKSYDLALLFCDHLGFIESKKDIFQIIKGDFIFQQETVFFDKPATEQIISKHQNELLKCFLFKSEVLNVIKSNGFNTDTCLPYQINNPFSHIEKNGTSDTVIILVETNGTQTIKLIFQFNNETLNYEEISF